MGELGMDCASGLEVTSVWMSELMEEVEKSQLEEADPLRDGCGAIVASVRWE